MAECPPLMVPQRLRSAAEHEPGGQSWLERLPATLEVLSRRWQLTLGAPFEAEASCSWVAPARAAGVPCVLKLALPHFEGAQEIAGLRFWSGDPTVRVLDADPATQHLLNCRPRLSAAPQPTLERVAGLLGQTLERISLWTFARLAVECSQPHAPDETLQLARLLSPA